MHDFRPTPAARFGLSPADRTKIVVSRPDLATDPAAEIIALNARSYEDK